MHKLPLPGLYVRVYFTHSLTYSSKKAKSKKDSHLDNKTSRVARVQYYFQPEKVVGALSETNATELQINNENHRVQQSLLLQLSTFLLLGMQSLSAF